MRRHAVRLALGAACGLFAIGCAMDVPHMVKTNPALQDQVMATIAADSTLARKMADHLLAGYASRATLVKAVMAHADGAREVMVMVAEDRTRLDSVLGFAVQDSSTKQHVITLFKGMQMAGAK